MLESEFVSCWEMQHPHGCPDPEAVSVLVVGTGVGECEVLPHGGKKLELSLLEVVDLELPHVYGVVTVLWADRCEHHMGFFPWVAAVHVVALEALIQEVPLYPNELEVVLPHHWLCLSGAEVVEVWSQDGTLEYLMLCQACRRFVVAESSPST